MEPKVVEFGVTTKCNLNDCAFCFRCQSPVPIPKIDLDLEVAKRTLSKVFLHSIDKLNLIGSMGDIMLYPHMFELIDHIAENCSDDLVVCIDTNGGTRSISWWKEFAKRMNQIKCYHTRFALDGLEDTYKLYRIGGNYKKVVRNMKAFIDSGGRAVWKFVLFRHNEHQIDEASLIAKKMGCTIFMVVVSGIHNDKLKPSIIYQHGTYEGILCRSLDTNYISIDADGEVMPCCYFKPIKNQIRGEKIYWDDIKLMIKYAKNKTKLNINTSTIEEAMNTDFFQYIYENHKSIHLCQNFCGRSRRRPDNIIPRVDIFIETPGIRYKY